MNEQEKKLAKLESILKLVDESITKEDFVKSWEGVISFIKKIEQRNNLELELLQQRFDEFSKKITDDTTSGISELKQQVKDFISTQITKITNKLNSIKNGKDGKNGDDGKDADESKIIKSVLSKIPAPNLQPLWNELDKRISEINAKIKAIPERPTTTFFGGGKTKVFTLDLSSQLNGVLKTFFIGTHYGVISVNSSSAPFGAFLPITDYNEVGKNIIFTSSVDAEVSLATGQSLIIRYLK